MVRMSCETSVIWQASLLEAYVPFVTTRALCSVQAFCMRNWLFCFLLFPQTGSSTVNTVQKCPYSPHARIACVACVCCRTVTIALFLRYLKEIGHPAEVVNLNLKEKEHRSPEFLKVWAAAQYTLTAGIMVLLITKCSRPSHRR